MPNHLLKRLVEHNNWANQVLLQACSRLTPDQLDAAPRSADEWTIRTILTHVAKAQMGYVALLSGNGSMASATASTLDELRRDLNQSGAELEAIANGRRSIVWDKNITSLDGYRLKPWTVFVQAINHATDHRRQVCSLFRAISIEPPRIDGWSYGESVGAVVPPGR